LPLEHKDETPPHEVADIHEFVELVDLEDVVLFEERGRRIDETAAGEGNERDSTPLVKSSMNIADYESDTAFAIGYRFRMVFDDRSGNEFVADFEARYRLKGELHVSKEIRAEFAERVAFFAMYPYLRASIQMTATRMAVPAPVLSMVRAGEFKLGEPMTEDDVSSQFSDRDPE
jgi:hypothetical protein